MKHYNWIITVGEQDSSLFSALEPPEPPPYKGEFCFTRQDSLTPSPPDRLVGGIQVTVNVEWINSLRRDPAGNVTFFVDVNVRE